MDTKQINIKAIKIFKTCSCGIVFNLIPESAILKDDGETGDGHYWNCTCGSTLLFTKKRLLALLEAS